MTRYTALSRVFHWVSALIVIGLLVMGYTMASMGMSPAKLQIIGLHKSFGMLVLVLSALRILWRGARGVPAELDHPPLEKKLAKLVHVLLYVALIGMPLSGWLMSSAGGFPVQFFGLWDVPALLAKNKEIFGVTRLIHGSMAVMLMGAVALHYIGAAKHVLMDKDETLLRMSPFPSSVSSRPAQMLVLALGGLLLLAVFGAYGRGEMLEEEHENAVPAAAQTEMVKPGKVADGSLPAGVTAPLWVIDHQDSHLMFNVTQYGSPFDGEFKDFDGVIAFDPDQLRASYAKITVPINSISTGSSDRDSQALGPDWLDAEKYPEAVFETLKFERVEAEQHEGEGAQPKNESEPEQNDANRFKAYSELTLRGVAMPVILNFTLIPDPQGEVSKNDGSSVLMEGDMTLARGNFGVGQGQWESDEAIGKTVKISITLHAHKKATADQQ